jgi:hypothetical protein
MLDTIKTIAETFQYFALGLVLVCGAKRGSEAA